MKEAFENLQNAEAEPREKIKVTKADIVVALPLGKPYFNIHYREVGNDYDNIGFGSYDLNNVIRWREEEMEIVSEVEAEYKDKFTSVGAYEQVEWERNVAIAQLKELGYGLGEKIRKVEAEYGNGWIPVESGKMPKEDERVLCLHDDGFIDCGELVGKTWCCDMDEYALNRDNVLAWMPLPEPYRPEKGVR